MHQTSSISRHYAGAILDNKLHGHLGYFRNNTELMTILRSASSFEEAFSLVEAWFDMGELHLSSPERHELMVAVRVMYKGIPPQKHDQ
ncbi:hypothetical protein [uncultured Aquitalea sp.]|uniref:hypothetical protein n=1 Tax=uncultured Aquitalea sp. TaxID=540272 RepID=UPI0025E9609C|nr:hypothetical protein [uncultured Aquitalea sp.]